MRELVQKEHATMGETEFTGSGNGASPHQGRRARGVMRRTERSIESAFQPRLQPRGGANHLDVDDFLRREWWQHVRQTSSEQRLAAPRRTAHEKIVASTRRDQCGPPRDRLPLDQGTVVPWPPGDLGPSISKMHLPFAPGKEPHDFGQMRDPEYRYVGNQATCLDALLGDNDPLRARIACGTCECRRASDRMEGSIKREFTGEEPLPRSTARTPAGGYRSRGHQDRDGDGQIVDRPFLPYIGRSEIDREPGLRPRVARVAYRGADPFRGFANRSVRKPDDAHRRQPVRG